MEGYIEMELKQRDTGVLDHRPNLVRNVSMAEENNNADRRLNKRATDMAAHNKLFICV